VVTTDTTAEGLEQRLAELQQLHAELTEGIAVDDADLATADEAVAAAQAVFDAVMRAGAEAAGPALNPYATWTPTTPDEERERSEAIRRAEGMREQAHRELGDALVARTKVAERRGHKLMMLRRVEGAVMGVEHDLELARQAPKQERDLLRDIRRRVFGGPVPAA
jgi:hypothetical protein